MPDDIDRARAAEILRRSLSDLLRMTCRGGLLYWACFSFAKWWHLTAVHAVVPGNSQSAGLDRHFYRVAIMEAIKIVQVDR